MIYYLNIRYGERHIRDHEGSDLPDIQAAREEAVDGARELMADAIRGGEDVSHGVFEIADRYGEVLAEVPFTDAIRRRL